MRMEQDHKEGSKSWKKCLQYIWDYYKLWIIGAVVLVGLICYFASIFVNRPKDEILDVAFVNFYDDVSEKSDFYRDFLSFEEQKEGEVQEGSIVFDSNYFFDLSTPSGSANTYFQKLVAVLEAGTCDALICEKDNLDGIGESGRLLDLRDERVDAIYQRFQDRTVTVEKDGQVVPVGIDISDSPVLARMNGYGDACYLGISSNAKHVEMVELLLNYLLEE